MDATREHPPANDAPSPAQTPPPRVSRRPPARPRRPPARFHPRPFFLLFVPSVEERNALSRKRSIAHASETPRTRRKTPPPDASDATAKRPRDVTPVTLEPRNTPKRPKRASRGSDVDVSSTIARATTNAATALSPPTNFARHADGAATRRLSRARAAPRSPRGGKAPRRSRGDTMRREERTRGGDERERAERDGRARGGGERRRSPR